MELNKYDKRYKVLFKVGKPIVKVWLKLFHNFTGEKAQVSDGPLFVLSNHTSPLDEFFIITSFPRPIYFVAGEHLWRMGWVLRTILNWFKPAIQRIKGSTDASTAVGILRALRDGKDVCLYPEGSMSYTGGMLELHPTTARLVKSAKNATLVTYRVTGSYFAKPRWAAKLRKGPQHGEVVGVYSPEELKGMSVQQVEELLLRDLTVDAYELQSKAPVAYKGKNLACDLETALYVCPNCGRLGTLKSEGDYFLCDCGLKTKIDSYGYFDSSSPFRTPDEWDKWQENKMKEIAKTGGDVIIFDDGQSLYEQLVDKKDVLISTGRMALGKDGFSLGSVKFTLREISGIDLVLRDRIYFSAADRHFSVKSDHLRCGRKYVTLFKYLKEEYKAGTTQDEQR